MMNAWIIALLFVGWYVFSLIISENIGKNRKIGVEWSFFLCFILSPIIGLALVLFSKKLQKKT